ncbi:MAG TPA: alanine racemase [Mogibacterium sp.]|nr:alanine racemase [Mogibacterium sp.]
MYKETLRQVWMEIDMSAFDSNVKEIKKHTKGTPMIGVLKANMYAHGATECAKVLAYNGVDSFAVATLEEAVNLREDGIEGAIVILGLSPSACADTIIEYDLTPVVMAYDNVKAISDEVVKREAEDVKCIFAVDTGMGRIGQRVFNEEEIEFAAEEFKKIAGLPGIDLYGVLTHFSTADEEQREYTEMQIANYKAFIDRLAKDGINPFKTIANSAGIMVYPEALCDATRPGIILVGLAPSGYLQDKVLDLKRVMSVHAEIVNLKTVPAGTSVSYARKFTSEKETKIATIGIGYADGYSRRNSGKISVLCGGKRCPVIGNICMDQCMVDVTDVEDVKLGDEIVIIGKQGNEEITAEEIAALTGTINYEVVASLDTRIPKVYKNYPEGMCK